MTIRLTDNDFFYGQLQNSDKENQDASDKLDITRKFNTPISQGWKREIDLREGIFIDINRYQPADRLNLIYHAGLECEYIKFSFALSANGQWNVQSKSGETLLPCKTGTYLIRSNGLTNEAIGDFSNDLSYDYVEVYIKPWLLCSFAGDPAEETNSDLQDLVKPSNQAVYCLQVRQTQPKMTAVLQQILQCSYRGIIKRAYLESKAIELIALVLENERLIREGEMKPDILKPDQKERIYYAREILLRDLNNPPSLTELAQQVGLNASLLGKGFQQIFGTTVFAQLQAYRLEIAQQLLAEQDTSVADVAHLIGYASPSYFSRAFKSEFGIGPKAYQKACR